MSQSIVLHEEHFFAYPRSYIRNHKISPEAFGKVAVLMGGSSGEREVSLESGNAVLKSLKNKNVNAVAIDATGDYVKQLVEGQFDRAFIILHGKHGEDGEVQGALESMKLPFTGSSVAASALAMDKPRSKFIFHSLGLPTPRFSIAYSLSQAKEVAEELGFPLAVKPVSEGSSLGTYCVKQASELSSAFDDARQYGPVLIEPWVTGRDIFVSVLGDEVFPSVEVRTGDNFYDYKAKYLSDTTQYFCPALLTKDQENTVRELAKKAFYALGCKGWGRVDFMLDASGKFWILEVNTIPGMTSHSLVPLSAKQAGLDFDELVMCILATSFADNVSLQETSIQAAVK